MKELKWLRPESTELARIGSTFTELHRLVGEAEVVARRLPQSVELRNNIQKYVGFSGRLTRGTDNNGVAGLGLVNDGQQRVRGIGFGALDPAIGTKGDTQGIATDSTEVMRLVKGSKDPVTKPQYGDVLLAHGGDTVEIGSKNYPTKWAVAVRSAPRVGDKAWQWSQRVQIINLAAGQVQNIVNGEDKLKDTDQDIYITLLDVGQSASQVASKQEAENAAKQAIAEASAAITAASAAGADMTGQTKSLAEAQNAFGSGDYAKAKSTADGVRAAAVDAGALAKKLALEKQADAIRKDTTLSAESKAAALEDIAAMKADVNTSAQAAKAGAGFHLGLNAETAVIGAGIGILIGAVALILKKK